MSPSDHRLDKRDVLQTKEFIGPSDHRLGKDIRSERNYIDLLTDGYRLYKSITI